MGKKFILSIDGGGELGLIPALFLYNLSKKINMQPREVFDFFIGTSTGGIMSLLLTSPQNFTTEDIMLFYTGNDAKQIFKRKFPYFPWDNFKYPSCQIEGVLQNVFKDTLMKDSLKPVVVTTYDTISRNSIFLNSYQDKYNSLKMWECARATSAAPTFFQPFELCGMSCCDGGIFANNPSFLGYIEAKKLFPDDDLILVNICTGSNTTSIPYNRLVKWSLLDWACNLYDLVSDGESDTANYALSKLLKENEYFSFNFKLPVNMDQIDNVQDKFLNELIELTKYTISTQWKSDIDRLVNVLGL